MGIKWTVFKLFDMLAIRASSGRAVATGVESELGGGGERIFIFSCYGRIISFEINNFFCSWHLDLETTSKTLTRI